MHNNRMNEMISKNKHKVAQWKWETNLDDREKSHRLQNLLSNLSQSSLKEELNRGLNSFCPMDHIWRIQKLELDLGKLEYGDLERELPQRFRESLNEALQELVFHHKSPHKNIVEIVTPLQSNIEALHCFLRLGTVPWWFARNNMSLKQLLETLLREQPEELASLLRKTGKSDKVRKRVVWQFGGPLVKEIIKILEPRYCKTILEFADQLVVAREEEGWDGKELEQYRWLWILKHLLVDRGTLFNTVMFVKQTIRQMAHYYQMDYELLLCVLIGTAQETRSKNLLAPVFVNALREIGREEKKETTQPNTSRLTSGPLVELEHFLLTGESPRNEILPKKLLENLLLEQPEELVLLLREIGKREEVRKRMVWQCGEYLVRKIVNILEPSHCKTILAFADHLVKVRVDEGWDGKQLEQYRWLWILKHLFVDRGTLFNTVMYMEQTIRQMAHYYQMDYENLLGVIIGAAQEAGRKCQLIPFFFSALLEIDRTREKELPSVEGTSSQEYLWEILERLLQKGQSHEIISGEQVQIGELFLELARRFPRQMTDFLIMLGRKPKIIRHMVNHFAEMELECVVRLTVSKNHPWVLTQISQIMEGLARYKKGTPHKKQKAMVWEVMLTCLYRDRGSYFNRREFTKNVLAVICKKENIQYRTFLYILLCADYPAGGILTCYAELLSIFQDLFQEEEKRAPFNAELTDSLHNYGPSSRDRKVITLALRKEPQINMKLAPKYIVKKGGKKVIVPQQPTQLSTLCAYWLRKGKPPSSYVNQGKTGLKTVMQELLANQLQLFPRLLQDIQNDSSAMVRLFNALDFATLVRTLSSAHPGLGVSCSDLIALHRLGYKLGIRGIHSSEFSRMLLELVLMCWRTSNWERLATGRIWQEMTWLMVRYHRVSFEAMQDSFQEWKHLLPPEVQLHQKPQPYQAHKNLPDSGQKERDFTEPLIEDATTVSNAGLVILQQYFPLYLERLHLIKREDKSFISDEARRKAAHYLQFLATGQRETEESHLALNKVICGLPLTEPLEPGVDMTPVEVELGEGLIKAMYNLWSAVGTTSLQGFRGNWLVRQGTLRENENQWDLTVEKKAYDLLLNQAPFTFSIIKLSWMEKPIHVKWSY